MPPREDLVPTSRAWRRFDQIFKGGKKSNFALGEMRRYRYRNNGDNLAKYQGAVSELSHTGSPSIS